MKHPGFLDRREIPRAGLARRVFAGFDDRVVAYVAKRFAVAPPAQVAPRLTERNEGAREIVFQAFGAVSHSLDVFENLLFVSRASHAPTVAILCEAPNPAKVPKR